MQSPGKHIKCCTCPEVFEWMYNDKCPKCGTDTEASLQEYYTQQAIIEQQYADHAIPEPDNDDEYDELLYKLYSY